MSGKLFVIEGLDGSGKGTQTELLTRRLQGEGRAVRKLSFPRYGDPAAGALTEYLHGSYGQKPEDVNAYAASTFFAVDRYASFRQDWREAYLAGSLILCDRYTTSNAVHQTAKLSRGEWDGFLDWLYDFEFGKLGIPRPAAVFYLDMPPEASQKLMDKRYAASGEKDIHEQDLAYLNHCRQAALYCCQKLGWTVIDCARGGGPRPVEEIGEELRGAVEAAL